MKSEQEIRDRLERERKYLDDLVVDGDDNPNPNGLSDYDAGVWQSRRVIAALEWVLDIVNPRIEFRLEA